MIWFHLWMQINSKELRYSNEIDYNHIVLAVQFKVDFGRALKKKAAAEENSAWNIGLEISWTLRAVLRLLKTTSSSLRTILKMLLTLFIRFMYKLMRIAQWFLDLG